MRALSAHLTLGGAVVIKVGATTVSLMYVHLSCDAAGFTTCWTEEGTNGSPPKRHSWRSEEDETAPEGELRGTVHAPLHAGYSGGWGQAPLHAGYSGGCYFVLSVHTSPSALLSPFSSARR